MNIFVVNAYKDRQTKYLADVRYQLFPAVWWEDVTQDQVDKHHFYHNAKLEYRKKVVACSLSHKKLLLKIIQEDLKNTIIIEDDAIFDFDRLDELKDLKNFTYLGGEITSKLMKNMKQFEKEDKQQLISELSVGINKIDHKIFKIGQTCGYFVPNARVAQEILSNIPHGNKEKAIDTELVFLQRKEKITDFIFPPLVKLNVEEAKKGFTYSNYTLASDQEFY